MQTPAQARLWFLDWVRVGAFAVLIPYHVGMFYSSWDWLVKSSYAGPAVDPLLLISAPFRLSLLFFVSGAATRFLSDRATVQGFARKRTLRLLPPLLFGMFVICAPIAYLHARAEHAIAPGFGTFLLHYWRLQHGFTWEHLWFVAYVLVYGLVLVPLRGPLLRVADRVPLEQLATVALLPMLVTGLAFGVVRGWFPITNNLYDDWSNHVVYAPIFLLGFLAVRRPGFWPSVETLRWAALLVALLLFPFVLWTNGLVDMHALLRFAGRFARCAYSWAVIVAVLGFARRWLDRPNATIAWLNRGVFCFYIVHLLAIVAFGYLLAPLRIGIVLEPVAMIVLTGVSCLVAYVIADRLGPAKLLFGLPLGSGTTHDQRLAQQKLAQQG